MAARIWISLLSLLLLALLPLLFGQLLAASLAKLNLGSTSAVILVLSIIVGSFINIPVRRIQRTRNVVSYPLATLGLFDLLPRAQRVRSVTVVAVNVGGCVIPTGLAIYELISLVVIDRGLIFPVLICVVANIVACYVLAHPMPGIGITLPAFAPAIIAAISAILLASHQAAPVAFIAGVIGPLVGADLLHFREMEEIPAAILSIGGAGTFDGILLSGILAAYLA